MSTTRLLKDMDLSVTGTVRLIMKNGRMPLDIEEVSGVKICLFRGLFITVSTKANTSRLIMPTSTLPFEVSLEFADDTVEPAILQLSRGDDELSGTGNATILHPQDTISLILNAGSTYRYILRQHILRAQISVRIWKDMCITVLVM